MALDQQLRLQTATSLVMTPQLQQAIKLLQFSQQELEVFITEQVVDNPLLVLQNDSPSFDSGEDIPQKDRGPAISSLDELSEWVEPSVPAPPLSLREHLINQINSDFLDPVKRLVATHLVGYVQSTGYFEGDLEEIAVQLGSSRAYLKEVLEALQMLDPVGGCAQTLKDCLKAQLKDQGIHTPAFEKLLNHLEGLAKGDLHSLRRKCQVDEAELARMIQIIRSLHPKPGLIFDSTCPATVIPDVLMVEDPKTQGWAVDLNPETMPKLLIDFSYYTAVRETLKDKSEHQYLADRFAHANWLLKALHQRATTLIRVSKEIIRKQGDFFTYGISYLKPLVLRDVAECVELHESTVSRVTNNKYIATPRGVFELKYFFNSSLEGASGVSYASTTIRHRIRSLIQQEHAGKPLSDDNIAQALKSEGIHVARRTIAKYREILKIPPAFQRKRWQAIHTI